MKVLRRAYTFFTIYLIMWVALLLEGVWICQAKADQNRAPKSCNLVIVTIDTLRADHLGCYGYKDIETPAIDRLANEGVIFTRHYTPVPITLPSHTTIMTGLYPPTHGVRNNGTCIVGDEVTTVAELLRKENYRTAAFVGAYVLHSRFGLSQGFEVYNDTFPPSIDLALPLYNERTAENVLNPAIEWLEKNKEENFFLWIHLFDPHAPYSPPEPFRESYKIRPYDGEIVYVDSQINRLRQKLKSLNCDKNTLFVLTSDHGEGLDEHGEKTHAVFIYDSTLHVPLIFNLPGILPRGKKISEMVSTVDIVPTIMDILKIPSPEHLQGYSLHSLIRGEQKIFHEPSTRTLYCESYYPELNFGWSPLEGIKTDTWKFIRAPKSELYRIDKDPAELHNIISQEKTVAQDLSADLTALKKELSISGSDDLAGAIILDPETRQRLESLGYVWSKPQNIKKGGPLPDPKDMIKTLEKLDLAMFYSMLGLYQKAIDCLEKVVKADPANIKAHSYLAANYEQAERYDEAIAEYQKVTTMDPDYSEAFNSLGSLYEKKGMFDKAIEQLEIAQSLNGNYLEVYHNLGVVWDRKNEHEKALQYLLQARELDPNHISVRNNLGGVYIKLGRTDEAIREFQRVIHLESHHAEAYNNLGIAYKMAGDYTKAEEFFKKAIEVNADDTASHSNLAGFYIMTHHYEKAIASAKEAVRCDDTWVDAYVNLGIAYFYLHNYKEAIVHLEKAIVLDEKNVNAHTNLGLCHFFLEDYKMAQRYYQKSLNLDPQNLKARINLGTIFFKKGAIEEAIKEWNKSLEIDSDSIESYVNLGAAYLRLEKYDEALKNWKKVLRLDPNHVTTHLNLGNCYSQMGLLNLAIREWTKTISLNEKSIMAHKNLASAYYQQGRFDLALQEWEKVDSLDPDQADAAYNLGLLYLNLGKYDQGIARLSRALVLDPGHTEAQALMEQVHYLTKDGKI
ncbi:MAG: tetratricopeptide repeat protein [bacterium]